RVEAQVAQAALRAGEDPVGGKRLLGGHARRRGPRPVLRRHLARDVDDAVRFPDRGPHELLAVAVAVAVGGVDEVDAQLDRTAERAERLLVVGADPSAAADAPRPEAELRDLEARPAERPVAHHRILAGALPARGAGPVDSRTTSSAWIRCCLGAVSLPMSLSISISAAMRPASNAGQSTPVSAGVSISANWAAITATIEKSSGTCRSAARSALSSPVNCQPVVIAAVHSGSVRSRRAATANASRGVCEQGTWMPRIPRSAARLSKTSRAISADV